MQGESEFLVLPSTVLFKHDFCCQKKSTFDKNVSLKWVACLYITTYDPFSCQDCHEFHETCHSVTFIVLVNSHQRWKQTRNRVCFHLWCELTLALWCHSIVWSLFSGTKMQQNDKFHGIHVSTIILQQRMEILQKLLGEIKEMFYLIHFLILCVLLLLLHYLHSKKKSRVG